MKLHWQQREDQVPLPEGCPEEVRLDLTRGLFGKGQERNLGKKIPRLQQYGKDVCSEDERSIGVNTVEGWNVKYEVSMNG